MVGKAADIYIWLEKQLIYMVGKAADIYMVGKSS
jgi:hypothetical protein